MKHIPSTHTDFVIEREFAAPPETVFQAWADPQAKRRWSDCHAEHTTGQRYAARHHKRCDVEALPRRIPSKEGSGIIFNSRTCIQNPTDDYISAQAAPTKPILDDCWQSQSIAGKRSAEPRSLLLRPTSASGPDGLPSQSCDLQLCPSLPELQLVRRGLGLSRGRDL
jgi:hypothetical protein